eukprot:941073_1
MSLKMYTIHPQFIMYCLFLIAYFKNTHATLSINHQSVWSDDFALDATGQNGWNIQKISDFDLPQGFDNPIVAIDKIPQYHGPFPAKYRLKRSISCNTVGDTQLYVSWLPSYCNTEGKGDAMDQMQLHINDHSETYRVSTLAPFPLTDYKKALDATRLASVQAMTATYYTGHASSSTHIPLCAQSSGAWFTSSKHKTFHECVVGGHEYEIAIEMQMSGEQDEYVLISNIYAQCIQLHTTSTSPTQMPSAPLPPTLPACSITDDRDADKDTDAGTG